MQPIHIVIPGKPEVWSRPRVSTRSGRVVMFDPKDKERKKLGLWVKQFFPFPLEGAIKIELIFFFATKDKKKWGEFKTSKADIDNLQKNIFDSLSNIAFKDDAQIVSVHAEKKWCENDSTHVFLSKM